MLFEIRLSVDLIIQAFIKTHLNFHTLVWNFVDGNSCCPLRQRHWTQPTTAAALAESRRYQASVIFN